MPTTRLPRLTRDSLEGTPGGACWPVQKDASVSSSRYMIVLPGGNQQEDRSQHSAAAASHFPPNPDARSLARYLRQKRVMPTPGVPYIHTGRLAGGPGTAVR